MPKKTADGPSVISFPVSASPARSNGDTSRSVHLPSLQSNAQGATDGNAARSASLPFNSPPAVLGEPLPSSDAPGFLTPATPTPAPLQKSPTRARSRTSAAHSTHTPSPTPETRGLRRAEVLAGKGSIDKAISRLQKLIHDVPRSSRAYLKLAHLLRENKSPNDALPLLLDLSERAPHLLFLREVLAELYLEAGRWDDAIFHARRVLDAAPRSLLARELLSASYLQKGELDRALVLTAEMIRLDPNDPGHYFKRGVLFQQKGQIANAVHAFTRVLEMDGSDHDADDEARAALEMLDSHQIRQIITLAVEDVSFRVNLRRAPEETAHAKGFVLSPAGLHALCQMRFDEVPTPPEGWRQRSYH